ncbi:cyclophilin-like fold protein [Gemmiger sp. An120]|uniref:cyclophilin-like fold protein n=1 Tax=Gemmiger sp. An120 TaxID=1965549 RepID=UPI001FA91AF9|nr:cyclophilin-like fold protein [Gemmiger sp. An120]
MKLLVQIGDKTFTARWENNAAARALAERAADSAVTVELRDYGGFEKVGSLGENLPADDRQLTTQTGDIVLYNGNQIVLFYGSNSWSYTPLGHIEDLTGWKEALGKGDVTVRFSAME